MVKKLEVNLNINGKEYAVEILPADSLNRVLRDYLGFTGTKRGCDLGGCGSCTVIVDGKAYYSCMYPAFRAGGKKIVTIEGLEGEDGLLDPLQEAFVAKGGFQCGYCTPGFIMSAKALLTENASPSEDEIKEAIGGNLCRCTGYVKIIESIKYAIELNKQPLEARRAKLLAAKPVFQVDLGVA
ncbi:MAG: (2Fe-2S)-binding protein [Thaumarchaeota archaeon]|nr:(2Fe-2S)-binding protein [Nitrososphaerota archaeon]